MAKRYDFEIEYLYNGHLPKVDSERTEMDLYFFCREIDYPSIDNVIIWAKYYTLPEYYEFIGTGNMRQIPYLEIIDTEEKLNSELNSDKEDTYFRLIHPSLYTLDSVKEGRISKYKVIIKVKCKVDVFDEKDLDSKTLESVSW